MIDLNLAEEYYCKGYILKKEKKLNEANEYFRKAISLYFERFLPYLGFCVRKC
jgi:tetratricopeptide (TPR) repeat protein